jgi:hypothetical protein
MSYVYDDFGNLKNNCLTVTPTSEPRNIRGLRSDANWQIEAITYDKKNNLNYNVNCNFGLKKKLKFVKKWIS